MTHRIFRQAIQQLLNGVVVVFFKLEARPNNTFLKAQWFISDQIQDDGFNLFSLIPSVSERRFEEIRFG